MVETVKIIVGHTNMDLDCIGSIVLMKYLYPDHVPIMSRLINPAAKNLVNLYQYHLNFKPVDELKGQNVQQVIIVDTRSSSRVKEYFDLIENEVKDIIIYDHHFADSCDFNEAQIYEGSFGSNTTMIGLELLKKNISISPKDATIALTGMYADTGNFTHDNICEDDFRVAAYMLKHQADIKLVNNFLKTLREDYQVSLFHKIMNSLVWQNINGHQIIFSYYSMDKQVAGLAAVVEEIFNIEKSDAIFGVFHFEKPGDTVIIGRSSKSKIDLMDILTPLGGGGHSKAASALIKQSKGRDIFMNLMEILATNLQFAVTAKDIMTKDVITIQETWILKEASLYFEEMDISGAPVLNEKKELCGMLTLRDIMKGRKNDEISAPVKAYMKTKLITCNQNATIREIEQMMFHKSIGHLPVVADEALIGIITREDFLKYLKVN